MYIYYTLLWYSILSPVIQKKVLDYRPFLWQTEGLSGAMLTLGEKVFKWNTFLTNFFNYRYVACWLLCICSMFLNMTYFTLFHGFQCFYK